jgi:alkanesulfonate monooxygenase SsuD/methylene tetrahydromethanopterin reductase-like flavin-dependent oxidoreductase (luciferase family)
MTHLAVALDGFGWHPAAWRRSSQDPAAVFTPGYWVDLVRRAEAGLLDFVTLEDGVGLQSSRFEAVDARTDQPRGRLDAVLVANRLAPLTSHIGLVPTATTTHTEPFNISTAIATLDYVSDGRAGWRPQVSLRPDDARLFGRRELPAWAPPVQVDSPEILAALGRLFDEAADAAEAVRRLWDSWEDDAVIRDIATGRFVDREKLHYIDLSGDHFSVRGPSITPRPPQGQPPVIALAHSRVPYEFAARSADVVLVTPRDATQAAEIVAEVRAAERTVGRELPPLLVFADLVVLLDDDDATAAARLAQLDALDGTPLTSDAAIRTTTGAALADELADWERSGIDGFRLRPGELGHDLERITADLVPALRARGAFRTAYASETLRGHLGLARPASRYATVPN